MDNDEDNIGWSLSSLMEYYNPGTTSQISQESQPKKKKDNNNNSNNSDSDSNSNNNGGKKNNNGSSSGNNSYRYNFSDNEEDIIKSPAYSYNNYQPFEEDNEEDERPIYATPTKLPKVSNKPTTSTTSSYSTPPEPIESSIPMSLPKPIISPTKTSKSPIKKSKSPTKKSKSSKDKSKSSKDKPKSSKDKSQDKETAASTTSTTTTTTASTISTNSFNQLKNNYESQVIKQIKKDFPYIELNKECLYSDSKVLPSNFTEEYLDHLEDHIDLLWSKIRPKDQDGNEIQLSSSIMKTLVYYSSKQLTDVLDHLFYRASIERGQAKDIKSFKVSPNNVIESSFVAGIDNEVINNSILKVNSILPKDSVIPIDYRFKCNEKFLKQDKEIKRKLQIESKFNSISKVGPNTALLNSLNSSNKPKLSKRKLDDLNVLNDFRKVYKDNGNNVVDIEEEKLDKSNNSKDNSINNNDSSNKSSSNNRNKKKKEDADNSSDEESNLELTMNEKSKLSKEMFEKIKLELKIIKYREALPDWEVREYPDKVRRIIFVSPSDNRFYYFRHALNWNQENNYGKRIDNIDKYLDSFNKDLNKVITEKRKEFNQDLNNEKSKAKQDLYLQKQSLNLDKKLNKSK